MSTRAQPARAGRAAPLAPPERRAAIIAATIPLLRESGPTISTRRIAEAAGVAEGTIFSVFPHKDTLIGAAVEAALAPDGTVAQLRAIEPEQPLEARLTSAVAVLQAHFTNIWRLLTAVGASGPPRRKPARNEAFAQFGPTLEALFEPATAELRLAPAEAARALLALALGSSCPPVVEPPLPAAEIVALFLDGVRAHS